MAKRNLEAIGVAGNDIARAPSKGQTSFNALIERIESRRVALAEWEAFGADFRRRYNDEFVPLRQSFDGVRTRWVYRLDQSHDVKGLGKSERQTIAELITHIAGDLLASVDDPGIAEIYWRYNVQDAAPESAVAPYVRDVMDAQETLDEQGEHEHIHREAREAYHAKRKRSPKRNAAEERARAEQAEVHLSIRDVYRKLASALHPDRERDPAERERKAVLMQRVNQAYGSKSLLDLLKIQLELEHIDQATLNSVSEDRLKRWNTILKEQLRGLDQELLEVEAGYQDRCGMSPGSTVSPKTVKRALTTNMTHLRESIRAFEQDLRVFDDVHRLKPWLKDMKRELAV